jgi:hypothetical protein
MSACLPSKEIVFEEAWDILKKEKIRPKEVDEGRCGQD